MDSLLVKEQYFNSTYDRLLEVFCELNQDVDEKVRNDEIANIFDKIIKGDREYSEDLRQIFINTELDDLLQDKETDGKRGAYAYFIAASIYLIRAKRNMNKADENIFYSYIADANYWIERFRIQVDFYAQNFGRVISKEDVESVAKFHHRRNSGRHSSYEEIERKVVTFFVDTYKKKGKFKSLKSAIGEVYSYLDHNKIDLISEIDERTIKSWIQKIEGYENCINNKQSSKDGFEWFHKPERSPYTEKNKIRKSDNRTGEGNNNDKFSPNLRVFSEYCIEHPVFPRNQRSIEHDISIIEERLSFCYYFLSPEEVSSIDYRGNDFHKMIYFLSPDKVSLIGCGNDDFHEVISNILQQINNLFASGDIFSPFLRELYKTVEKDNGTAVDYADILMQFLPKQKRINGRNISRGDIEKVLYKKDTLMVLVAVYIRRAKESVKKGNHTLAWDNIIQGMMLCGHIVSASFHNVFDYMLKEELFEEFGLTITSS